MPTRSNGERSRPTPTVRYPGASLRAGLPVAYSECGMRGGGLQVIRRLVEYGALGLVHRHGE
ncbi:hypothetical protein N0V84_005859 [Fusarium piperis]|uniref:Uncharacterized protein n=1 Tax=Fusarium piperis TaxID=1435070 RepID=A0A9W8WD38_9HYPO|nr:hypothetical protein N0V84_005859 [Fusarium piperis]